MTFPAGITESSFDVSINDDNILEDKEDFMLIIDSSSISVGAVGQTIATIVDDDGK